MNSITRIFIFLLALATFPQLYGQYNPAQIDVDLTQGIVYRDTIHSSYSPTVIVTNTLVLSASSQSAGLNKHVIEINMLPNVQFTGNVDVTLQYTSGTFPPQPRWSIYKVNCQTSLIKANDDYIYHNGNDQVVILPVVNDETTADTLILSGIGQVQNGSAFIQNDTIVYTPADNKDDYIIYTIQDNTGNKTRGKINILFEEDVTVVHDTLYFTLLNTKVQPILFPFGEYTLESGGLKGTITEVDSRVFEFAPNKNSTGTEILEFAHDNGSFRRVEISIKAASTITSSVRDDVVYTPKNTNVTFNVFDNDISRNFPINQYSPQLTYLGSGNFSYTPPNNFVGIKQFTYRVNYGTYNSTGKITVFVDNCYPKNDIEYRFNSPKNVPLAVQYDVPIDGYTFSDVVNPLFGTLEFFNNEEDITYGCNNLSSKAMFVYTPDQNYYGEDEFQVNYCINDNQCVIYKFYITIKDQALDTLCHCVGKNCVWPGDFDNDGFVTVLDLLPLGRYLGLNGAEREDIVYDYWNGQSSSNWGVSQKNGTDIKHIDANGDGILDESDAGAIAVHFLDIHNVVSNPVLTIKDYPFNLIPNQTELDSGDLLILTVDIGNNTYPLLDQHGLAFNLEINPEIMDSSSLNGEFYTDGWFAYANPTLQMFKQPSFGNIHTAFTRTGGNGVSGHGPVGQISFIVIDEIDGWKGGDKSKLYSSRIFVNDIIFEDEYGDRVAVPNTFVDIQIRRNGQVPIPSEEKLIVYPNPASDYVYLHFNGRNTIYDYTLADMMGRTVQTVRNIDQQSTTINTQALATGMYSLRVTTSQGVISKKLQVVR
ncbi:MAG: T9SS type A sorting domain-containing protein [Saprospiraceae bacterium]